MKEGVVMEQQLAISLFDKHGRRIPYGGMRVYNQVSRRYFLLEQPEYDCTLALARGRMAQFADLPDLPSANKFSFVCGAILAAIEDSSQIANLAQAVCVPFICPPKTTGRGEDIQKLLAAVQVSFLDRFPEGDFRNLCEGKPNDEVALAQGSRYEKLEAAREQGWVAGWYFPNCLAEFDLASQRKQMETLPETVGNAQIVLSGAAEAAMAIAGTPGLLFGEINNLHYPHHLCLSALQEPGDALVYTFEHYANTPPAMRFRHRSNMLTPTTTQVSEQWAGGLTVFTALK